MDTQAGHAECGLFPLTPLTASPPSPFCLYLLRVALGLTKPLQRPFPQHHTLTLSSLQLLRHVQLFATPWTAACQASLSITNSWSLLKLMSIASVMPSNHLMLCRPLLLLPSIFPSIRVFSNASALHIRWPKYWSFSFKIRPFSKYSGLISFRMDWLDLLKSLLLHHSS